LRICSCFSQSFGVVVGCTNRAHLSRLDQLRVRFERFIQRRIGVINLRLISQGVLSGTEKTATLQELRRGLE
jgi:hypothetical protein